MSFRKILTRVALMGFVLLWPIAVMIYGPPTLALVRSPRNSASSAELQNLLQVRRFTLEVPKSMDGWSLGLVGVIDGEEEFGGSGSVTGGASVVLLLRYSDGPRLEFCWGDGSQVTYGSIRNPLLDAKTASERTESRVMPDDWLVRGGRMQVSSDGPADFELRVSLRPPNDNESRHPQM